MLTKLTWFFLLGIETLPVEAEIDVSLGVIPKTLLVGLPEAAIKESRIVLGAEEPKRDLSPGLYPERFSIAS